MKKTMGTRVRSLCCVLLASVLFLTGVPVPWTGVRTVHAESGLQTGDKIIIRFTDVTGRRYYRDLQTTALIGETITLPALKGYRWSLGGEYSIDGGEKLELLADARWSDCYRGKTLTFQAEKFYYVQFFNSNGSRSRAVKALTSAVAEGKELVIPEVPAVSGYVGLGWSEKKNDTDAVYKAGDKVEIKGPLKLYAVQKKVSMALVTFSNNDGRGGKAYRRLKKRVETGSDLTLPEVPRVKGYTGLGWTTEKGGTSPLYKAGSAVRVSGNVRYYAVRQKSRTHTVSFYRINGRSSADLKKLRKKAESGSYIVLPEIPVREDYVGLGWSTRKNRKTNVLKAGTKYLVRKNTRLYAVIERAVTVSLCKNDGTLYRDLKVGKGDYLTLPSVSNSFESTFLGWSRTMGKSTDPEYEAGGRIRVNKSVKLYAVIFDRRQEKDLTEADFADVELWKQKYKQVIFVGDSRTDRMKKTLERDFGSSSTVIWNVRFVCSSGKGLQWLKTEGGTQLMEIVNKNNSVQKPTAVIFNLGVNDLVNLSDYVTYMKELAPELTKRNCQLFYMSVNPGNSKMMENTGHMIREESVIRQFNNTIRTRLAEDYTYIDAYNWLLDTGYGTNAGGGGVDVKVDDGLHYTTKTYKRIFQYCLNFLLTGNGA